MAGRTGWQDLRGRTIEKRAESPARVELHKRIMELDMRLGELRELRGTSQTALAEALAVSQPNVSRIEREDDIRLSTLERYVQALGGRVEIRAFFPDTVIQLHPTPEASASVAETQSKRKPSAKRTRGKSERIPSKRTPS